MYDNQQFDETAICDVAQKSIYKNVLLTLKENIAFDEDLLLHEMG